VLVLGLTALAGAPGASSAAAEIRACASERASPAAGSRAACRAGTAARQLRLGVQWNHVFATYVQAQGLIGGFIPGSAGADVVGSARTR